MNLLSSGAIDVLGQMFLFGPVWDGNVVSKAGRDELIKNNLAYRYEGWQSLTREGLKLALEWPAKSRADQKWYRKQLNLYPL